MSTGTLGVPSDSFLQRGSKLAYSLTQRLEFTPLLSSQLCNEPCSQKS